MDAQRQEPTTHDKSSVECRYTSAQYKIDDLMQQMMAIQMNKSTVDTIPEWTTDNTSLPYVAPYGASPAPGVSTAPAPVSSFPGETLAFPQPATPAGAVQQGPISQAPDFIVQNICSLQEVLFPPTSSLESIVRFLDLLGQIMLVWQEIEEAGRTEGSSDSDQLHDCSTCSLCAPSFASCFENSDRHCRGKECKS